MSEISIVTAYFHINRENWKGFERSTEDYLAYFDFWARIQNNLIVYTNRHTASEVLSIRKKYNLDHKTKVIIVEDIYSIDEELYQSIVRTIANPFFRKFRLRPTNPETIIPEYIYLTLLKSWFVKDAIQKGYVAGKVAWLDFGFNHGGKCYSESSEFDFLWEFDFDEKINLFTLRDIDDTPIFEIVRKMEDYITAGLIVAPDFLWIKLWKLTREAELVLNKSGMADDEQTIMVMVYRENPEIFTLHKSTWFMPLKDFGGGHLTIINNTQGNKFKVVLLKIMNKYKCLKVKIKYSYETFKLL
ncbi:hypothetical protein OEV98_01955 [Caldibacillus lycopersici]|uniref:HtrL family protein n=1 Tax=Perspicuibacillus lycopersici TaxID=1325689 RepID=A0AAE3LPG5_9BACI|nr:WlaTC/HtrL family glycosyltransferase [Perspicuibacillus lycopersici]MCU9612324.1 hypothetical protein [Perspicuibacillus lycopersici]